jgi:hypothetical protein
VVDLAEAIRDLRLAAGASTRDKLVVVRGRTPEQVRATLGTPGGARPR